MTGILKRGEGEVYKIRCIWDNMTKHRMYISALRYTAFWSKARAIAQW